MSDDPLPLTLAGFRGRHAGETILVCGCGSSLNELRAPERFVTVGVNDVGRLFDPTYLVVLNPRSQFRGDRFRHVEESRSRALFTQLGLGINHPHVVRFRLGARGGTDTSRSGCLPYTRNSPYVALALAIHLGAKRVGLLGVDFTDDHFFAPTGRHPLSSQLARIDREYGVLARAARERGVEVVNLSAVSRLTSLPKASLESFCGNGTPAPRPAAMPRAPRTFFVHYRFLACGDVFSTGLANAARALGIPAEHADWDDPRLEEKVCAFAPDLLFVVHGRRFAQRWRGRFRDLRKAVWLLDEPYEVDDTARWSRDFDTVFVNDPATLGRHRNAHYLPVAFDPDEHADRGEERSESVGFIGGGNPSRERTLLALAREGLLSYVVGGPWKSAELRRLCRAGNVPPAETAALYRRTRLVLNVFRDRHHFNRAGTAGRSLNPRIYEALACGALVVSERRPELAETFPELPAFDRPDELPDLVRGLLADEERRREILGRCRARLAGHGYRDRLHAALTTIFGTVTPAKETQAMSIEPTRDAVPTYSIVMVTHNSLATTRIATLRTLRHTAGQSARLVVVDNASSDGTAEWLRLLARRGGIDLIESGGNPGHGPGLELGLSRVRSPYLVTLDSDAFPIADSWLDELRRRLDEDARAAGILHHRGYIHPSCLMVPSGIFAELGATLLNEKDRPGKLDVAERLSQEIVSRGGTLAGLERCGGRRRGSRSEPVWLGSTYGGIVYHQWYTTRAALAGKGDVDDVRREDLELSLAELIAESRSEPRAATVVMGVRVPPGEPERLRNARAALTALALQDLPRWKYRIVVVEQDAEPRCERELAPLADEYLFVRNPGPYNRGWGFNVGVSAAGDAPGGLCLLDADLLVPPDFLRGGLAALAAGARALLPYREVLYLTPEASEAAIARRLAEPGAALDLSRMPGQRFKTSQGGAIWVDPALYRETGGHDERFEGWGSEDREILERLGRLTRVARIGGTLVHLDHPRPQKSGPRVEANRRLRAGLRRSRPVRANPGGMGDPDRHAGAGTPEPPPPPAPGPGRREWESWHRWAPERIRRIVENERHARAGATTRRRLAGLLAGLGDSLLDVGCGPGAVWLHLASYRPRFTWEGLDATPEMVTAARRFFPGIPVHHGDAADLPFEAGRFDVVLLRHVLEHLPDDLMARALAEATRVARRAVVVDFFLPPGANGRRETRHVGEGFLETRWTEPEILAPIEAAGWRLHTRRALAAGEGQEDVWILAPAAGPELLVPEAGDEPFKISIVMPTYRRPHCLPRTIATVQAQTYRNWELILVDNAGDLEPTFDDPRIRLVRHAERPSSSWARNQGLAHATGDLVCFFDDDDEMFPTYLESFADAFAAHPRAQMVRCGMVVTGGKINYSYATPECCVRRAHALPVWDSKGPAQDQRYFQLLVRTRGWSEHRGDIVTLRRPLCRANADPQGGLRAGGF